VLSAGAAGGRRFVEGGAESSQHSADLENFGLEGGREHTLEEIGDILGVTARNAPFEPSICRGRG